MSVVSDKAAVLDARYKALAVKEFAALSAEEKEFLFREVSENRQEGKTLSSAARDAFALWQHKQDLTKKKATAEESDRVEELLFGSSFL